MAGLILYRSPLKFISPKQYLFLAVIWFWGLRLTSNFVSRGGIGHEDWRYAEMREAIGRKWFPLLSLPMVFLGQSTFNFIGCLSIYGMMRNSFSTMRTMDMVGLSIVLGAIVLETAADEQLDAFVRARSGSHKVLDTGLWSWSRHPNYFGELAFWWGLWVCGGCELGPAIAGPLGMTLLFLLISVPLMEERQLERKGNLFLQYQRKVPSALVPLPPALAHVICSFGRRHPPPPPAPEDAPTGQDKAGEGKQQKKKEGKKDK
jgi:steroid 5-alpha reductase family enzyme